MRKMGGKGEGRWKEQWRKKEGGETGYREPRKGDWEPVKRGSALPLKKVLSRGAAGCE